jgi:hypothetical protein
MTDPRLDPDDESQDLRQHAIAMLLQFRDDPSNINAASFVDGILAAVGVAPPRPSEVQALAEQVSDALAATTEGTNYDEAPEPSDEPGSPYVMRLTNELHARGVRVAPSPTEDREHESYCVLDPTHGGRCYDTYNPDWLGVAPSPDAPDPVETFGHPYRSPVVIDGHLYLHTSDCDWPARAASPDQQPSADPRPPYVLRLTGEQIGSITPPPEGDWFVDWDEYEDFVPRRMLDAALPASPDAPGLRERIDAVIGDHIGGPYPEVPFRALTEFRAALLAALAASGDAPREGLDVNRLTEAMLAASWPGGVMGGFTRRAAEAIAREYASESHPTTKERTDG